MGQVKTNYGKPVTENKTFVDNPLRPVKRHWICPVDACGGEMIGSGRGMTTMRTDWEHRCNRCGYEEWTTRNYPAVVYLPPE